MIIFFVFRFIMIYEADFLNKTGLYDFDALFFAKL